MESTTKEWTYENPDGEITTNNIIAFVVVGGILLTGFSFYIIYGICCKRKANDNEDGDQDLGPDSHSPITDPLPLSHIEPGLWEESFQKQNKMVWPETAPPSASNGENLQEPPPPYSWRPEILPPPPGFKDYVTRSS